jgi:hypothetical protein
MAKWAQEDVETLYSLLNNNNIQNGASGGYRCGAAIIVAVRRQRVNFSEGLNLHMEEMGYNIVQESESWTRL